MLFVMSVSRKDFELLGFKFNGKYYIEKALPFGCSISCRTFKRFATFLDFAVTRRTDSEARLLDYLDDYLGGHKSYLGCRELMLTFRSCLQEMSAFS